MTCQCIYKLKDSAVKTHETFAQPKQIWAL